MNSAATSLPIEMEIIQNVVYSIIFFLDVRVYASATYGMLSVLMEIL